MKIKWYKRKDVLLIFWKCIEKLMIKIGEQSSSKLAAKLFKIKVVACLIIFLLSADFVIHSLGWFNNSSWNFDCWNWSSSSSFGLCSPLARRARVFNVDCGNRKWVN